MSRTTLTKWIAVIALGVVTVWVYHPRYRNHDINVRGFESSALARSIAEGRGFSDPFQTLPTGPSAHLAPLYPAYLALILTLFGNGPMAGDVLVWASLLTLAIQLMLFPTLAKHLGLGFWAGVVAAMAWIAAGIPPIFFGESTLVAVLVICAALLMKRSLSGEMPGKQLLLSGVVWGALLLLQPVVIVVLAVWLLLLCFRSQNLRRQAIALGALPLLIVAPWITRNFVVFHRPIFIRDNLGLELAVSNNPCASPLFAVNDHDGCFASMHPNENYDEALKVREMGEAEYNRARLGEAMAWIRANPLQFAELSGQRFEAFWVPTRAANNNNGTIWRPAVLHLFTLLSIPGLFLMWRSARPGAYVVLLWLGLFPPIYYFIQYMDRYRYPIFWATFLAGSYFIVELVRGIAGMREPRADTRDVDPLAAEKA
ncbi:MAG TPA: hypothetical protein VMT28_17025 [Terriglobales bacterium]|jgi:hypothetical protein|nr:hypothetical protein [Terriglobales bacterium]